MIGNQMSTLSFTADEWRNFAFKNGYHESVITYISFYRDQLDRFGNKTWSKISDIMKSSMTNEQKQVVIRLLTDATVADEFWFIARLSKFPEANDILDGNVAKAELFDYAAAYALVIRLCYALRARDVDCKKKQLDVNEEEYTKALDEYNKSADNMISFLLNNAPAELIILGVQTAFSTFKLTYNVAQIPSMRAVIDRFAGIIAY
jgi:hypothetical protein